MPGREANATNHTNRPENSVENSQISTEKTQNSVQNAVENDPVCPGNGLFSVWSVFVGNQRNTERERVKERVVTAFVRGAGTGLVLRGGLHLVSKALAVLTNKSGRKRLGVRHPLEETLRYTAFLGSLGGVYVLVDEGLAAVFGKQRTAKWRALVAGFCAGPTILLTGSDIRHNSLALYVLFRGLTLLIRCGNKPAARAWLRILLTPTRWKHGDTALMCMAGAQILYSFVQMPHTMPRSYVNFLHRHASQPHFVWEGIRELLKNNQASSQPSCHLNALKGTGHLPFYSRTPCPLLHPNQTCAGHVATFLPRAYARALPVYFPVYLLPALVVHRKRLIEEPLILLPRVIKGTMRSSLFLALFIGLAYTGTCAGSWTFGTTSGGLIAASVTLSGLATLVEKKSRRMELALYCVTRAVETFSLCLVDWGVVKPPKWRLDVILFSAAVAAIMHCYSDDEGQHRDTFKSKYLNVLDFVFGNSGLHIGHIKHVPSNQDLLVSLEANGWFRWLRRQPPTQ